MKLADFDQAVEETTQYERDFAMQMMDKYQTALELNRQLITAIHQIERWLRNGLYKTRVRDALTIIDDLDLEPEDYTGA